MFMSGVESKEINCSKHLEKVDVKTCMLCPYYKKFLFTSKCHYIKRSNIVRKAIHVVQESIVLSIIRR